MALVNGQHPAKLDPVLKTLFDSASDLSLAGAIFADGSGQEEAFITWSKRYQSLVTMEAECNMLVNDFIAQHFQRYAVKSIHAEDIAVPDEIFRELFNYARRMTFGRRAVSWENSFSADTAIGTNYYASPAESVFRPLEMFRSIAIGSALIARRQVLTADDVQVVRHIAFSSIPDKRRTLLRCLIQAGGRLTSPMQWTN